MVNIKKLNEEDITAIIDFIKTEKNENDYYVNDHACELQKETLRNLFFNYMVCAYAEMDGDGRIINMILTLHPSEFQPRVNYDSILEFAFYNPELIKAFFSDKELSEKQKIVLRNDSLTIKQKIEDVGFVHEISLNGHDVYSYFVKEN